MKMKQFDHIGINVKDIEASLKFYCELLGLKVQMSVKMQDCTITYLVLPNGNRIELFDYFGNNKQADIEDSTVGYRHIAIEVDNVDEYYSLLLENDIPIVLEPTDLVELNARVLLFKDPSGTVLDFCQPI